MTNIVEPVQPKVFNGYYTYHMIRNSSKSFLPEFYFPCRLVSKQTGEKLLNKKFPIKD